MPDTPHRPTRPDPPGRPRSAARPCTAAGARATMAVSVAVMALVVLAAACAPSNNSTATAARPRTSATLQILSPTPNQVTGPSIDLELALHGATVVSPSQVTGVDPTEGHIHVSLDGKLVTMTYGLHQQLNSLTPGTHTVQAEFVASDHRAFANRVVAAVLFQVK